MLSQSNIGIFGGDMRQVYLADALLKKGYHVYTYKTLEKIEHKNCTQMNSLRELFEQCKIVIGPIPFNKDHVFAASANATEPVNSSLTKLITNNHILIGGIIPSQIVEGCQARGIPCYDYMNDEKIAILNAIATAEGTILEAIKSSDINLHGSNCLILGYGRCAKVLAGKLKALDARVTIAARSPEALAYAEAAGYQTCELSDMKKILSSFNFIFNTIPALVLDKDHLAHVDPKVTIIDIASQPGGVDFEYAIKHNLNAKLCLGIPGKVSPKTSADIILSGIMSFIKERSD